MASKRRLRRKQCGRKKRHPTFSGALLALKILHHQHGHQGQMNIYRCQFCGTFHIGHSPGRNGVGSGWK